MYRISDRLNGYYIIEKLYPNHLWLTVFNSYKKGRPGLLDCDSYLKENHLSIQLTIDFYETTKH